MMRKTLSILAIFLIFINMISGQNTFSKIIEFEETIVGLGVHLLIDNDNLILMSNNLCDFNSDLIDCTGITVFNEGNVQGTHFLKKIETFVGDISVVFEDELFFTSYDRMGVNNNIGLTRFSLKTGAYNINNLSIDNNNRYATNGLIKFNSSFYAFGHYDDLTPGVRIKGFIKKWNKDFTEELEDWTFGENEILRLTDLQITQDSNLVFAHYEEKVGPNGPDNPIKIIKIDTLGNIIRQFEFIDSDLDAISSVHLVVDKNDHSYINHDTGFKNRLSKVSADLDAILWNVVLPSEHYPKDRGYSVKELIIAENGDLIATGAMDYMHLGVERAESGFMARIDSETGEIKWLKILSNEVKEESARDEILAHSRINDIIETPNGHLCGVGEFWQSTTIAGEVIQEIWMICIDANGCMDGFDCEDDIYVLNAGESFPLYSSTESLLPINEKILFPNPVQDKLYLETTDQTWNYQILNLQGQLIGSGEYRNHIDVEQLPTGIYFLQLEREGNLFKAIKFVKE